MNRLKWHNLNLTTFDIILNQYPISANTCFSIIQEHIIIIVFHVYLKETIVL